LGISIEGIEIFDEKVLLQEVLDQTIHQQVGSVNEMIAYFKNEIAKRDQLIEQLQAELDKADARRLVSL